MLRSKRFPLNETCWSQFVNIPASKKQWMTCLWRCRSHLWISSTDFGFMDWLLVSVFHLFFGYGSILSVVPGIMIRFSDVLKGCAENIFGNHQLLNLSWLVGGSCSIHKFGKSKLLLDIGYHNGWAFCQN